MHNPACYDPIVLVHARALLTSTAEGSTTYLDADLRDTAAILSSAEVAALDFSRPIAISLVAILQFIIDDDEAYRIIDDLVDRLVPGSALAISTVTAHNEQALLGAKAYTARGIPARPRTDDEVRRLFRDLDLVDPGVTLVSRWRPTGPTPDDFHVQMAGGVAVKR